MHARIQIYWGRSSIFRHLKLELLTQFPASNDEKYINVVYIWRTFVSFYGYVHWRVTTEISVMYGSEKVNKLLKYCIRGIVHDWLFNNHSSDMNDITCGVPQGSILGSLLFFFICECNCWSIICFNTILYADDTSLFIIGKNINVLFHNMKNELAKVVQWLNCKKNVKNSNTVTQ